MKVVHRDQVRSVHRFSAFFPFLRKMGRFSPKRIQNQFFSQMGPIYNLILCTFLPKHLLATVNLKGLP